ncbi:hypothetical protein J7J47_03705 [Halomonas sp. ISL-60]|uniref:hypothetical protein n=1 Tax=Halomonas sp. ISL-56 TaxID=2819149 RepID=UPI001BE5B1A0|nr:hypothetical protein [Halomonas sp. ISL-56]MBT2771335.1 hypothetical protein [Halomonas sp. ISL-60]MBT2800692.1 hypothetical protein [Halomonas sp. ISL-56]
MSTNNKQTTTTLNSKTYTHTDACKRCKTFERYIQRDVCVACKKADNSKFRTTNENYMKDYFSDLDNKLTNKLYLSMYRQLKTMKRLKIDSEINSIVNAFHHVDYTLAELKAHLESKFVGEMKWENYGDVWELDHIISINSCVKNNILDFNMVHSLVNLQPLFSAHNKQKRCKSMQEFLSNNASLSSLYTQ